VGRKVSNASQSRLSVQALVASCALLAAVIVPAAGIVSWIVNRQLSTGTIVSAAVGGGICLFAASAALVTTFVANQIHAPVQGVLASLAIRMGLPLIALIALPKFGGALAAPGISATILGVYLVSLIVETILSVRMVSLPANDLRTA